MTVLTGDNRFASVAEQETEKAAALLIKFNRAAAFFYSFLRTSIPNICFPFLWYRSFDTIGLIGRKNGLKKLDFWH